jgi:hypothetical protein
VRGTARENLRFEKGHFSTNSQKMRVDKNLRMSRKLSAMEIQIYFDR